MILSGLPAPDTTLSILGREPDYWVIVKYAMHCDTMLVWSGTIKIFIL